MDMLFQERKKKEKNQAKSMTREAGKPIMV